MPRNTTQKADSSRKPDISRQVIDAALKIAARGDWSGVGLAAIGSEAGLPLHQVFPVFPSKTAILDAFAEQVDLASLGGAEEGEGEPARDRIFDIIMRRFDALAPHKDAVAMLLREVPRDPPMALGGAASTVRSMRWTLEASGISASGLAGMLRAKLLTALYLSVLRTWLDDESPDLTRTMAMLDRRLRGAASWLGIKGKGATAKSDGAPSEG